MLFYFMRTHLRVQKGETMNAECRIALYKFCRGNGWSHSYVCEVLKGIPQIKLDQHITDVDEIKFIPDEYTIGPIYDENERLDHIEVCKDGIRLFCLYPA